MSLAQVGARLGVSASAVWKWETGDSQVPSADLPEIARALGVSVAELFGEASDDALRTRLDETLELLRKLVEAHPRGVQIDVYPVGEYTPTPADSFTRSAAQAWLSAGEERRRELEAFLIRMRESARAEDTR